MNKILLILFYSSLILSCTPNENSKQKDNRPELRSYTDKISLLTEEEQSAFDALNAIQVNTDSQNRLYSTFAGIVQPCYPADTSYVITQSELLIALTQFIEEHCKNLDIELRDSLARTAVLAQAEYELLHCLGNSSATNNQKGIPMKGTWIMPGVLGRRDIIIEW